MAKRQLDKEMREIASIASIPDATQQLPITLAADGRNIELEQQVRELAFQLYEQRGRQDGHAEDDWIQAEAIILATKEKLAA